MARYCRIITRIINDFSFRDNWLLVVVPADLIFLRRFSNFFPFSFPFSFSFFYFLDERRRTSLVRTNYNGKNLRGEYHQTKMWCFDFDTFALLLFEYRLLIQFRHVDAFRRKKKKKEREKRKKKLKISLPFFLFPSLPPSPFYSSTIYRRSLSRWAPSDCLLLPSALPHCVSLLSRVSTYLQLFIERFFFTIVT